jgi:hypothetical protein
MMPSKNNLEKSIAKRVILQWLLKEAIVIEKLDAAKDMCD